MFYRLLVRCQDLCVHQQLAKSVFLTDRVVQRALLVELSVYLEVVDCNFDGDLLARISRCFIDVDEMQMQQVVRWQVVEITVNFVLRHSILLLNRFVRFLRDVFEQR